jgi:PilZ domain
LSKQSMRRHRRRFYNGAVRVSWTDSSGDTKYVRGTCVDVSEGGLRLEGPEPIPVRSYIGVSADRIKLAGTASVRSMVRHGAKYLLGVELSQPLRTDPLDVQPPLGVAEATSRS